MRTFLDEGAITFEGDFFKYSGLYTFARPVQDRIPIKLGAGDVKKAVSLFEPHYAEKLSLAGTPEEVVEKIKSDLEPAGVNHMILALSDPSLVKLFSGQDVPNVPDINGQLKLVAERVMHAFG